MSNFRLPIDVTFWVQTANTDGAGGKSWTAAVTVKARAASTITEVIGSDGKEQISRRSIYTKTEIPTDAYIFEGTSVAAAPVADARRVIQNSLASPTMSDMNRAFI